MGSAQYQLNAIDLKKIGIGALIAMGGAGITYLAQIVPSVNFGVWSPVVAALFAILLNAARKFLQDNTQQ